MKSSAEVILPQCPVGVDVLIVAGEHSGDAHAADIVRQVKGVHPEWKVCALGGPRLADAGAEVLFDLPAHSVVGLIEVLKNYGFFKALFEATVCWIKTCRPRAILLVDYPGFNLRLAKRLQKEGVSVKGGGSTRVLFYISPQIWAWKKHRRFVMAECLDALAVIFPFEVSFYQDTSLPVRFVGHPFVCSRYVSALLYAEAAPVLMLPGSRLQAVSRIFPVMLKTAERLLVRRPEMKFVVLAADERLAAYLREQIRHRAGDRLEESMDVRVFSGAETVRASAALTSSGTMSLQVALAGIPAAIVYVAHPLTWWLGKRIVNIKWLGISSILLNRTVMPEYLQEKAEPQKLSEEVLNMTDGTRAAVEAFRIREELIQVLRGGESGNAAAEWLIEQSGG